MEETFKEFVIEKIGQMEKQISFLSGSVATMDEIRRQQKERSEEMAALESGLSQLSKNANIILSVFNHVKDLSGRLERYNRILENPVEKKEHHIHHFRWPMGVAIGIFLLLVLAVSALCVNHQKLRQYIANDTKYRNLQLVKDKNLQHYLYLNDSLYRADPAMRKQVLEQETAHKRKLELLMEAREKRREAEELEKKAGRAGR